MKFNSKKVKSQVKVAFYVESIYYLGSPIRFRHGPFDIGGGGGLGFFSCSDFDLKKYSCSIAQ